ncbi:DUF6944 family repetitive protein [Peribacillus asahii]|uniref:Uncharacterized protein n=1 Tax=Peribacillus asahii TaxID=228899 RepID=A0A3T0KL01_9BACI|nr:hypothetical protein [Peribacillus asahii]AZV40895.1 hypothetical protein BAOM_0172 [Peribacillus asahii]USK85331.1 hypothetical protein LIT35_00840 [Peribacillus asahii]
MDNELKESIDLNLTNNQFKEVFGAAVVAIGTILSAIGNTPLKFLNDDFRENLDLYGNTLQATGNALQADGAGGVSLGAVGSEIQAMGNSTVIMGLLIDFENETEEKLIITGNWMQALGGLVSFADEIEGDTSAGQVYNIIGNLLQSIGNSLQAIGGIYDLEKNNEKDEKNFESYSSYLTFEKNNSEDKNGESLTVSGSWIQATGSVLSLIGQIKECESEPFKNDFN